MPAPERTVVVGGGVAGLVAARELALTGREVLLLESTERLGGQLTSHSVAGIHLDAGAEAYAQRGDDVPRLLRALGLDADIVTPRDAPAWLHRADGSAVPLPATSLLGIPGVPLARDVIAAIGMRAALRAELDNLLPGLVAAKAETVEQLVRRRMGRGVLEGLVAPVARGVHSLAPGELPVEQVAPGLRALMLSSGSLSAAVRARRANAPAGSLVASLRGGLFRLVEALERDLVRFGVEVRTGVEVTAADATGVTTIGGERIRGDVVVAAPLDADAPRTRVTVVTLVVDAPGIADAPRGSGVLVARGAPGVAARALTHLSAKWQWLADASPLQFIRLSYDDDVEVTPELARRDAEALLGASLPHPVDTATVRWQRAGRRTDTAHAIDGMRRVGEAESGTGLAAVVSYARSVIGAIPSAGEGPEG
ncbi:MAG: protoporphyrinogen/coproporphyrinogen oxidase [Protaetiibacter sp.]